VSLLSGQLKFPSAQIASTDVNTLDDYEEGTWTPTDGSGAGLVFTSVSGRYIKVGKQVTWWCNLTYPATASGANAALATNLVSSSNNMPFYSGWRGFASTANITSCMMTGNGNQINLYNGTAACTNVGLSGATIYLGGTYEATA
jgi:hypothetical protein